MRSIRSSLKARYQVAYLRRLEHEAVLHTCRLSREAHALGMQEQVLTIQVHGQLRADAYMKIGWHPVSETYEAQQWGSFQVQVPIITLSIERWVDSGRRV